jgi:hypothetical protein
MTKRRTQERGYVAAAVVATRRTKEEAVFGTARADRQVVEGIALRVSKAALMPPQNQRFQIGIEATARLLPALSRGDCEDEQ